jgi:DNA-binding response OmpR family regulator
MEQRRLLIVDDEVELLVTLKGFFERRGYLVWVVDSGEAALEVTDRYRPHVVLLDVHLGTNRLQGFDVLRQIKTRWPLITVLMWSNSTDARKKTDALTLGADDLLEKPLSLSEVLQLVQNATGE